MFSLLSSMCELSLENDSDLVGAAINGDLELVKKIVSKGGDIHILYEAPLRRAAENGHIEVVQYLVFLGADIHKRRNEALLLAANNGHLEVVKYLVSVGADIHEMHNRALIFAAQYRHIEVVNYLISKDANIDAAISNCTNYIFFDHFYIKKLLNRFKNIKRDLYKGPINEKTETECAICLMDMDSKEQKIIQCKTCKKCVHNECILKCEDIKCVYCRN